MRTTAVLAVSRGASGAAPSRRWPLAVIGATEDQRVTGRYPKSEKNDAFGIG